jgi:diguanylate cyclase (GGDEF)-like protein/PAS domain S-box-containing protein
MSSSPTSYLRLSEAERLKTILEGTNSGTWEWNIQTGETIFNERWAEIIGYTLAELQPVSIETWSKYAHPNDLKQSEQMLNDHFDGKTDRYECEVRMKHRDGHWVWVKDYGRIVTYTDDGKPEWMSGTHIDVTNSKENELRLEDAFDSIEKMIAYSPGVIYQFELKPDGTMCFPYASSGIKHIYNVTPEQVKEDASIVFDVIHPDDIARVSATIEESQTSGKDWTCEYRVAHGNGYRWVYGHSRPEFFDDGRVIWHGMITDITQQKRLQQKLQKLATTDELTSVANRRHFIEVLEKEFSRCRRYNTPCSVIILDCDYFKNINDNYGHDVGDQVLQSLAQTINDELRSQDTLGRIGGEEFAIVLPETDIIRGAELAERIRAKVEKENIKTIAQSLTITLGITELLAGDSEAKALLKRADKAMYLGKQNGRNRVNKYQE